MDQEIIDKYQLVVGLEVHAQLLTQTKIFNSDENEYGALPNTNVGVITLGHPGTMPLLNENVMGQAVKMGLACSCSISEYNIFDRKNYFYPDLPKGYQITQDRTPICVGGRVVIYKKNGEEHAIQLNRIHVEEDAGKSIHLDGEADTLVDFNRAGVPLIEIVSEPDIRSSEEAHAFLMEVRKLVRYLDVCDGNMEEGSMRCDANISVMLKGAKEYGKKVEVKNMNSLKNVQRAIDHEFLRQVEALENGETIISETRTFNAQDGTTSGMRAKEELNDYRYFPDPDLSPFIVTEDWLNTIKANMPALPRELYNKYMTDYRLPAYDAQVLTESKEMAFYFEAVCAHTKNFKAASNIIMGPVKSYLNEHNLSITNLSIQPEQIAEIIALVDGNKLSFSVASQKLFPAMLEKPNQKAETLAEALHLLHDGDVASIETAVDAVLAEFPDKVAQYQKGKKGLLGMFMGQVKKKTQGKADPKITNELLIKKLG